MSLNSLKFNHIFRPAFQRRAVCRAFHSSTARAVVYTKANLETFSKLIAAEDRITVADFYADWCGPCHQVAPVIEKLTDESCKSGSTSLPFDLVKVDTDTEVGQILGGKYKIRSLPTVIAFRNATAISQFVGAINESDVKKFLDKL
jgi:thioredoxin 1